MLIKRLTQCSLVRIVCPLHNGANLEEGKLVVSTPTEEFIAEHRLLHAEIDTLREKNENHSKILRLKKLRLVIKTELFRRIHQGDLAAIAYGKERRWL